MRNKTWKHADSTLLQYLQLYWDVFKLGFSINLQLWLTLCYHYPFQSCQGGHQCIKCHFLTPWWTPNTWHGPFVFFHWPRHYAAWSQGVLKIRPATPAAICPSRPLIPLFTVDHLLLTLNWLPTKAPCPLFTLDWLTMIQRHEGQSTHSRVATL